MVAWQRTQGSGSLVYAWERHRVSSAVQGGNLKRRGDGEQRPASLEERGLPLSHFASEVTG